MKQFLERHFPTARSLLGSLGRPLFVRQLQADFRRPRFFRSHLGSLVALAVALVVLMTLKADQDDLTPTRVGRSLFSTFLVVQYLIVLVVFPAFSATAFSEERSSGSLDLLTTTRLSPGELVWGKFLASLVFCLLYVIGSVPLLAIAFLFGGVTPLEVFVGYSILVVATLFVSILGVWISSAATGNVQATLATYLVIFAWLTVSSGFFGGAEVLDECFDGETTPVAPVLELLGHGTPYFFLRVLGWVCALVLFFGYLFQFASKNVTAGPGRHSTALRVLTLLSVPTVLALAGLSWFPVPSVGGHTERTGTALEMLVLLGAAILFAAAWLFSGEKLLTSPRQRVRRDRLVGVRFLGRLFVPGSASGAVYSVVLSALVCGGGLVVSRLLVGGGDSDWVRLRIDNSLLTLPCAVAAFSAFGFFLSSHDFAPRYARLTSLFTAIIVVLLPLIFYLRRTADAVWTFYYMSPITLWFSGDPERGEEDDVLLDLFGYELFAVARLVYAALAVVLTSLALHECRQRERRAADGEAEAQGS